MGVQPALCAGSAGPENPHRAVPRNLKEVLSWSAEQVAQGNWMGLNEAVSMGAS
jgi:hypothetical protein